MTDTYNMKQLSDAIAARFDLTHKAGAEVARYVFDTIADELAAGKQVRLHRFGTLEAKLRKAGQARNPITGAPIKVPARRVIKLTASPSLKQHVSL